MWLNHLRQPWRPNHRPMNSIFLPGLALLLSLTSTTLAQEKQKPAQPRKNGSVFRTLHNPVISADGAWTAAEERPDQGDRNVRVWSTEKDVSYNIEGGQKPRFSRDSRWVSALQKPLHADSRTAKQKISRAGQTLVLLDTQDGSQRTFDFVLSHDWTYSFDGTYTSMHLVYLQSPEMKVDEERLSKDEVTKPATKPAAKERKVGTLHLVHLQGDGEDRVVQNVTEYATYQRDRYVAYVVHDCQVVSHAHEEQGRDSLHIVGYSARHSGINAIYDGERVEGLHWARDRLTLGFLDSTETIGNDGKRRVNNALYTWPSDESLDPAQPLPRRWRQGFKRVDTQGRVPGEVSSKRPRRAMPNDQEVLDSVSRFAEMVLGERLRTHYTEHKRGNLGVSSLFESAETIGYTTFSNELYQKSPSPVDVEGCVLFAAKFKNEESAEWAFNHLKSNSAIRASEVKGMAGIVPVQVRFLEQIRNAGALFTQQGNFVFYLPKTCGSPPVEANWEDYENLFLQAITKPNEEITVINTDCGTGGFRVQDVTARR